MAIPDSPEEQQKIERLREAMYSRTLSEQLHPRDRRTLDLTHEIVGDDFQHPESALSGKTIAPRGLGVARTALWWLLVAAVVFFLCAVGFFAYYFIFGGGSLSASASNIDISVSGPPEVSGGGVTQLEISVTNRNTVPLQLAELVLTYPPGTRSASNQPVPDNCSSPQVDPVTGEMTGQRICLDTINPGQTVQGEVPAIFSGVAGQEADVKIQLQYHLTGSNSTFIAPSDYSMTFGSSPLSIAVDGNSQTISGQPVQFTVTVASNATAPIKDALLSVNYPFGFTFKSASPAPNVPGLWELGTLNPGESRSITLQGTLTGDPGTNRTFQFTAGTRANATSTIITTALANEPFAMDITQSFLGLALSVNGASTTPAVGPVNPLGNASSSVSVSAGQPVAVSINYVNNLPTAIQNAIIVAQISGVEVDGTTVKSTDGFYRSSDDSMLWNSSTEPGLASIPAGAKGTLKFTFVVPTSDALKNVTNPHIVISISAAGARQSESGVPQNLQAVTSQTIGIASDLELAAQGLYYSNPFGSTGPIPPKAGTETTYGINFTITNTTNEITDASLTGTLPPYIRWLERWYPAPDTFYFRGDGKTIPPSDPCQGYSGDFCWSIGDIPAGVGENGTMPLQSGVAIGFTPSTSQIGSQPALIQNIKLSGIDPAEAAAYESSHSGQAPLPSVLLSVSDVTTNLAQPSQSSAGIVVVPDPGFVPENATVVAASPTK